MTEEERPVHHVFDCSTGETTHVPVTDDELAQMQQGQADAEAALKQQEEEDAALREAVANHTDPVVKALAARLGISSNS